MVTMLVLSIPMSLVWMVVTATVSVESFIVGCTLGFAILLLLQTEEKQISWGRLPDQLVALVVYTVTLMRDIWMSSLDVARRVLNPHLPLKPGIIAVDTQEDDVFTAAFSAHGITMTPGELVVDFDSSRTMYVHCLDVDASTKTATEQQSKRLNLLRRMLGK